MLKLSMLNESSQTKLANDYLNRLSCPNISRILLLFNEINYWNQI